MGKDYDAILKEKPVYIDNSAENKYIRLFMFFGIFASVLVVIISYAIYFNTVLDNESIFLNNFSKLGEIYSPIYKDILFDYDLSSNYLIEGTIDVGNDNFKYSFTRDANKVKRVFFNDKRNITYYEDGNDSYIKISDLGDFYIKEETKLNGFDYYNDVFEKMKTDFNDYLFKSIMDKDAYNIFNQIYNIDNLSNIRENIVSNYRSVVTSDKYVRKIYFYNKMPVVEVNLILNKQDINNILGSNNGLEVEDDYQINITMKNDAIKNGIVEAKIVINNATKNERSVLTYDSKKMDYVNAKGDKYIIEYGKDNNNVQIKKNNTLYSVIQLSSRNNTNIVNYKIINKIYTVGLSVEKVSDRFQYTIETNIDNVAKAVKFSGEYKPGTSIDESVNNAVALDSLDLGKQAIYKRTMAQIFK